MAVENLTIGRDMEDAVARAVAVFTAGGVVVFPTETVYGIGVVSGNAAALEKLRRLKERPPGKPFQFLAADIEMAKAMGAIFNTRAAKLARNYWPGPLTLVVPDGTGTSTLGMRVPASPFIHAVCRELGRPIISSSANPSGSRPPVTALAADAFGDDVDLLIDAGEIQEGVPSTVVRCDKDEYQILRHGGIGDEAIEAAWNE